MILAKLVSTRPVSVRNSSRSMYSRLKSSSLSSHMLVFSKLAELGVKLLGTCNLLFASKSSAMNKVI